jgi:transposase
MKGRFPEIWVPSVSENDLRELLWHRQKLVWIRVSVKNQLHSRQWARACVGHDYQT